MTGVDYKLKLEISYFQFLKNTRLIKFESRMNEEAKSSLKICSVLTKL